MGNTYPFKRTIRGDLEVPAGVDHQFRETLRQLGAREHPEKRRYWRTAAAAVLSVFAALAVVATVVVWSQGRGFEALSGVDAPPEPVITAHPGNPDVPVAPADWLPEGGSAGAIGGADYSGAVFFNGSPVGGYTLLPATYETACQYLGGPIRLPALPVSTDYDLPLFFTYHPEDDGVFPEGPFWVSVQYEISGEPAFAFGVGRGALIDEQALYEQAAQAGLSIKRHMLSGTPVYRYGKAGTFGDGLTLTQTIFNVSYCWDQDGLSYSMPPPPGFSDLDTVARIWSMIDQMIPPVIAHENDKEERGFDREDIRLPTSYAEAHGYDQPIFRGSPVDEGHAVMYRKLGEKSFTLRVFKMPDPCEKLTDYYSGYPVMDEIGLSGETVYRVIGPAGDFAMYALALDGLVYEIVDFTYAEDFTYAVGRQDEQYLEIMASIIQG